jgi:5-oxoprolinase (ATP-hydrolysing) subunit A
VRAVDLNCDLGEGAGADAELMPLVSSANIACGAHAGDEATMRETVRLALRHGVAIGAHPGFADREHFGRRESPVSPREAGILVVEQVRRLQDIVHALGGVVHHVKLHGALYNQVSRDRALAAAVVAAVRETARLPLLYVLSGSVLETVAREQGGVAVAGEFFADRTYQRDGALTPRTRPDALVADEATAVAQVLRFVRDGKVRATDGTEVTVRADTVCLHGDGPQAVPFARRLRAELAAAGVAVRAPAGAT